METNVIFVPRKKKSEMVRKYFETRFMEEADQFFEQLGSNTIRKVLYNIELAEYTNNPKLFKKLQQDIWEFRTRYLGKQIRLLAFWDKSDNQQTLVIATHGFIKKVDKVPSNEIIRAVKLRDEYFKSKTINEQ